jgi:hypothetical protein
MHGTAVLCYSWAAAVTVIASHGVEIVLGR